VRAEDRREARHGSHHDGSEAEEACFIDGVERGLAFNAFGFEREVNHHDGVLLDDTDEKDDAMRATMLNSERQRRSARMAPTPADGNVERIVIDE